MIRHLPRAFCLCLCLICSGCGIILPQSDYTWSENYALDKNGGRSSIPEVNDGNLETFGRLGVNAAGTLNRARSRDTATQSPLELRTFGRSYSFAEAEVFPQVNIQFREKLPIDKIIIHGTNVYTLDVYWRDDESEWQQLAGFRQNPKNPVVIREHAVTDAILIDVRPRKPVPSRQSMWRSLEFALEAEAHIKRLKFTGSCPRRRVYKGEI